VTKQFSLAEREDLERRASIAAECVRLGSPEHAWGVWERLRADYPDCRDWDAPLAASYLGFALDWTSDLSNEPLETAQDALGRGIVILAGDLSRDNNDVTRWVLVARALEQRCMLFAFGAGWTSVVRAAVEHGALEELPEPVGDSHLVRNAITAALASLDLLVRRPDLPESMFDLVERSRYRLAVTCSCLAAAAPRPPGRPQLVLLQGGKADVGFPFSERTGLRAG
jgi:hypothetical protein